jgi:ADP-ribose pyrophosphatase
MIKPWRIIEQKTLYSAPPYIELSVETVELPDGRIIRDYHHLAAGSFVSIVAETEEGRIIALNQYRHGVRRVGLGLPGGRIDAGEEPLSAAQRELLEETGFVAEAWKFISAWDTSCTYGFTKSHYFHAKGIRQIQAPASDDLEHSEMLYLTRAEILQRLRAGDFISLGHAAPLALMLLDEMAPSA